MRVKIVKVEKLRSHKIKPRFCRGPWERSDDFTRTRETLLLIFLVVDIRTLDLPLHKSITVFLKNAREIFTSTFSVHPRLERSVTIEVLPESSIREGHPDPLCSGLSKPVFDEEDYATADELDPLGHVISGSRAHPSAENALHHQVRLRRHHQEVHHQSGSERFRRSGRKGA